MKKTLLSLFFLSLIVKSYSQNSTEEFSPIQKFIESTVQIPFMARVANVQDAVNVRITVGLDSLPVKYEITKSLRPDCDSEALRVVKLLNINMLRQVLNGKKKVLLGVPFFNKTPIAYGKGYLIEYFDKNNKRTNNEPDIKLARRYSVDSLTGIINGNIEYFEYKKGKLSPAGVALLKIDDMNRNNVGLLESPQDTNQYSSFSALGSYEYPPLKISDIFDNGIVRTINTDESRSVFYPNGRIEKIEYFSKNGNEEITKSYKWFANGQPEFVKVSTKTDKIFTEKFISVWDTTGQAVVINGNGFGKGYYLRNKEIFIESGDFLNGLKEGKWIAKNSSGIIDYEENYKNGVLIEGKSYEGTMVFPYKGEQNAEYIGGMMGFANHLQGNLKYPSEAQRNNVSGKVYVQFVVCTDGTLCDYKVLKGVGYGCDEESVRVLKLSSGKWKPGNQRGRAVRSKFTIPINYQLSR
jgi:TonB family protein